MVWCCVHIQDLLVKEPFHSLQLPAKLLTIKCIEQVFPALALDCKLITLTRTKRFLSLKQPIKVKSIHYITTFHHSNYGELKLYSDVDLPSSFTLKAVVRYFIRNRRQSINLKGHNVSLFDSEGFVLRNVDGQLSLVGHCVEG
jgi:hypothetical protein